MSRRESSHRNLPLVSLRRLTEADLEATFKWRNHPDIQKWCRQYDALHLQNHRDWYAWQAKEKSVSMYAVCDSNDKLIGVCGLTSIDLINRTAEFSLYIAPGEHGSGYGEACLRQLIKKGFLDYGLNCIWGETFETNKAANMFERVGFKLEGVRRNFYFREGKFINCKLYSILRSEYV